MKRIEHHFSKIAGQYAQLRNTDIEPVIFIKNQLNHQTGIQAADIGCGTGRYDMKLYQHVKNIRQLICIDRNKSMLSQVAKRLNHQQKLKCKLINAASEDLPIADGKMDSIFSFNALHHFNLPLFFQEASRILKHNGILFVYTRLRSQNRRNIWGKYFPGFHDKETRLYEIDHLKQQVAEIESLELQSIRFFKYNRKASLDWLLTCARNHHYSTFCLYDETEFEESLKQFQDNLVKQFDDLNNINWLDENVMLSIRKKQEIL